MISFSLVFSLGCCTVIIWNGPSACFMSVLYVNVAIVFDVVYLDPLMCSLFTGTVMASRNVGFSRTGLS